MEETKKVINYINDCNESYLSEAFKGLSLLEDDINLSNIGDDLDDELSAMVSDDVEAPVEEIVDINADEETELSDTYEGKVILECNCCHSRIYKDGEEVIIEEDTANPDDECPVCGNTCGYTVIGKIQKFDDNKEVEPEEDEDDEHEDEEEKNESLTEGAMSLKDRLARKHLFDAEESFDEEPIEESAINEDNWDKLVDTYPELEDGEVYESINESVELTEADFKIGKTRFQIGKQGMPKNIDLSRDGFAQFEDKAMREIKPGNYIHVAELGPNDKGLGYGHYKIHDVSGNGINGKVTLYKADFHKPVKEPGLNYISGITVDSRHPFDTTIGKLMRTNFTIGSNPFTGISENDMSDDEIDSKAYFGGKEYTHKSADELMADYHERNDKAASDNYHATGDKDLYSRDTKANNAILRDFDAAYKLAQQKSDKHITKDWKADQISKRTPLSNKAVKKNLSKYHTDADYRESLSEDLGDDAADFLWEGNKITVDGEDYEIISMGADVLTVEDADGQTVEFDLAELAGKPYSVVDYDGEYYEHKPSVGESLTEDDELSGKLDKKSRKLIYDGDDAYEAAKIDLIKLKGSKKIKWAELHPNKNETPSPEALKHFEITYELGESLTEDDDEDICPECGKKPCDCEKHEHHHGHHCEEGCGKRVDEAVEVHASGEDEVDVAKNDDGSMTINVGQTQVEGESIVPLSDEDQTALEANTAEEEPAEDEFADEEAPAEESEAAEEETEEEAPAEEGEEENTQEESYSITNFNEHKFNDLVEGFLRKVYENVNTFETTRVQDADDKFFVEGLIKYKSGKAANTRFVFENAFFSKNGSLVMEGYNSTFSNNGKSFRIRGSLNKGNFVTESMIYNYNVKQLNEANKQETVTISGRVKAR